MKTYSITLALGLMLAATAPAQARSTFDTRSASGGSGELSPVLQCVPYARDVTGIRIFGDAHTWWGQAAGRYKRGHRPQVGAVMAVQPHANSRLGHVAAVSRVIDSRTILLRHANWSERGKIEDNVKAVDVSPGNDWSKVRIWHGPSRALGTTHWPVHGFIYGKNGPTGAVPRPKVAIKPSRSSDFIADIIAGRVR